ncbi:MAG: oxidoreductase, partial [Bacteriovoracaceae bacterium]|nr:oxidoreductase [Bacteriovoracaceae bacterium]
IECIHEIDTTQIPLDKKLAMRWDTSPSPRDEEHYDVFLITGFHHTHAPLAIYALQHNSHAVVEKPIVVSGEQLRELITVMENSTGELFSCFHKRYLPFNEFVTQDLGLNTGDPVSYHCIIYEVPLPELHWYLWPNSKSRLVSNGCHWIDHFLYLNNFCDVSSFDLVAACDGTINCSVSLENDAFFTMVLTDRGSERIGVQDYIELRANEVSVKMINGSIYVAEDKNKILRRKKINKMKSYELMYQQIGEKILSGSDGDTAQSVKVSAGLIIALENKLKGLSDKN